MANFMTRFANVAVLKRIEPGLLMEFLEPFRDFLVNKRNLDWPDDIGDFDYTTLAKILMSPSTDMPGDMINALCFVDELSDPEYHDRIRHESDAAGIELSDQEDPSPADDVLRLWLVHPEVLLRVQAEFKRKTIRRNGKKYESFLPRQGVIQLPVHPDLASPNRTAMEQELDVWFEQHKKGKTAQVAWFADDGEVWFFIWHGKRIRREGTIKTDGTPGYTVFRPERYDILVYYPNRGELALYTDSDTDKKEYCRCIGKHMLGDEKFFELDNPSVLYTLQPLIDRGQDALVCGDVPGLKRVTLTGLFYSRNSGSKNQHAFKGEDAFAEMDFVGINLKEYADGITLQKAMFRAYFTSGTSRAFTIEPPRNLILNREDDFAIIHEWLNKRAFYRLNKENEHAGLAELRAAS